jgi:hypothetical protein
MKYVSFPWPQLEAALSIFNDTFFSLKSFENKVIKSKDNATIPPS